MNFDPFYFIALAFFAKYINKQASAPSSDNDRFVSLLRGGYDEDILTIPDDISEARSRMSYRNNS